LAGNLPARERIRFGDGSSPHLVAAKIYASPAGDALGAVSAQRSIMNKVDQKFASSSASDAAQTAPTIGLLYPGEMGVAVAALLARRGLKVITTLRDRSPRTSRRCHETGIVELPSLHDVVQQAQVVISLVSPAAAEAVAHDYFRVANSAPAGAIYVDANSIRPELAAALAALADNAGSNFVDASINGLAANLANGGTLFLSGPRANEIARLFEGSMRVRLLGTEPDRASAMKMLLSGLAKGTFALMTELSAVARKRGMLDEAMSEFTAIYPGITSVALRMLPSYSRHAARRSTEMREVEETAWAAGIEPCVLAAVSRLHEAIAALLKDSPSVNNGSDEGASAPRSADVVLRHLLDQELLSLPESGVAARVGVKTQSVK
jgi:3-hydroxyisobutyrate dehydrogenase-like beta-hydroxyacid dehydrogenase